ncbi:MAG: monovalent cation/H+ antiporter complex subunit F [Deltaproteobacteria bacterium]|nr:monovalent cation/H+ antiporter complex subunit F [Deltaproteobacteria bacterium]
MIAFLFSVFTLAVALIGFIRSKNIVDRAINFDLCFMSVLCILCLLSLVRGREFLLDFVLVGILLSFVGTVLIVWHDIRDNREEL